MLLLHVLNFFAHKSFSSVVLQEILIYKLNCCTWCQFPQDNLLQLHLKVFWNNRVMLDCVEWTSGLSARISCVVPFLGWSACNYWEKKSGCSEKSHYFSFASLSPLCMSSLSSPSLSPLHLPFLTLDIAQYCSRFLPSCVLCFSPACFSQFSSFPKHKIYSAVLLPLWLDSLSVCLLLSCSLNLITPHALCLLQVGVYFREGEHVFLTALWKCKVVLWKISSRRRKIEKIFL